MAQKMPVIRRLYFPALIPQFLAIAVFAVIAHTAIRGFDWPRALVVAAGVYWISSKILRAIFVSEHRAGIQDYRAQQFESAIAHFEASRKYFLQHPTLDAWRALVFAVASPYPYRTMALVNMAFCFTQIGKGQRAIELYEEALKEAPDYLLAQTMLKMLRSTTEETGEETGEKGAA